MFLYMVRSAPSPMHIRLSMNNFVCYTLIFYPIAIAIVCLPSLQHVFDYTSYRNGGRRGRNCCSVAAAYCTTGYFVQLLFTYAVWCALLCPIPVLLDCSVGGVSPPLGAIRNRRKNFFALLHSVHFYLYFIYTTVGF